MIRYGLNNKKRKLDRFLQRNPFLCTTSLVASQLLSSEGNRKSKDAAIDEVPQSIDRRINVCKTRTIKFVRQCHVYHGKEVLLFSFHLFTFPFSLIRSYDLSLAE